MTKDNKNISYIIKDKIYFTEEIREIVTVDDGMKILVQENDHIKQGEKIASRDKKTKYETIDIVSTPLVTLNQEIKIGDIISQKGKIFKKKTKSKFHGIVKEISDKNIKLLITDDEDKGKPVDIKSNVDGVIENVFKDYITIKYSGLIVNAYTSKGNSSWGNLIYINSETFKEKNALPKNLKGKIIVTDYLTEEMYPVAVSLECAGIIANSVDYNTYKDIILLTVPVMIHSGFSTRYKFAEDLPFVTYVRNNHNKKALIDTKYNRLIIPIPQKPKFLPKYTFNLKHIGVIV